MVKGPEEGLEWSTVAEREGADLWRRIWARASRLNGEGIEIRVMKVKGHAAKEDVQERRVKAIDAIGNHEADRAAVQAAKMAELDSPTKQQHEQYDTAMEWYKWSLYIPLQIGVRIQRLRRMGEDGKGGQRSRRDMP